MEIGGIMALIKNIELENGLVLNYHRITSLNKLTNISNTLEISSYIDKKQRLKEKKYQQLQLKNIYHNEEITIEDLDQLNEGINVLVEADFIELPYDSDMTIQDAYKYLKTTDKYKNAQDDIEV
jgi:cell division FtsZ-interacting protein ZapD